MREDRERINVTFDSDTFQKIKTIAHKQNRSMSDVCRDWVIQGLNGKLNSENLEFLTPIIREQLKSIIEPSINRLAALSAKTCIQASAGAYLSAEAINKFVPEEEREEVYICYEAARKKAVAYTKSRTEIDNL